MIFENVTVFLRLQVNKYFVSLSLSKGQTFAFDRLRHPENYAA